MKKDGNEILFKLTVYNPKYFLPSSTEIKLKFNIPNINCKLNISPDSGKELVDYFDLSVTDCSEPDGA